MAASPSAPGTTPFDVDAFLDSRRFGRTHAKIVLLLLLAMLVDGYDIFVVGFVLPFIAEDLGVAPQALTGVFIIQQLGLLIGTLLVGPISDRFGRRSTLLVSILCFSLLTLVTAHVRSVDALMLARFISSLFFAGVIPNAIALSSEIAPRKLRAGIVSLVFCGFTGGHFIGAAVQAWTVETMGWQSAFWIGAGLGFLILALLYIFLPESIRFRAERNGSDPRIRSALLAMDPELALTGREHFVLTEVRKADEKALVLALFSDGRLTATLLLWVAFLAAFIVSQLMGAWSTTMLRNLGGISMQHLAAAHAFGTVAGIVGVATSGFLIDRFGSSRVIPLFFLGGAISIASYAVIDLAGPMLFVTSLLSGYFANSALGAINALGSLIYPSRMRATGVSWAAGAGRAGGMIGPAFGGFMLAQDWSMEAIFVWTGAPLLIAALAIWLIGRKAVTA